MAAEKKTPRKKTYEVLCGNIYFDGKKYLKGEKVTLSAKVAKDILDGDKEAGRAPRIGL